MKRILSSINLLFLALIFLFSQCDKENADKYDFSFHFITEDYEPLNYTEDSRVTGLAPDLLEEICKSLNIPFDVEVLPWSEGYSLAQERDNAVLFSTILNAERKDVFKWAGPFASLEWYFYAEAKNPVTLQSLDDAMSLTAVGTFSSWFSDQVLRELGFTNLVSKNEPGSMTKMLMEGEIDAFVCSAITFPTILKEQGYAYDQVTQAFTLMSSDFYIAFSRNTSPTIVNQWQSTLEAMQQDGTYNAIHQKWFT